ncbi:hypothetical protein BLNAU_12865 [Blattamonas nauphoetae]|uniref:Uncharacterized protein n=1 Tax=Blattamonas nauphoetae TaxID=2049346 RepID=A0ABQ9XIB9_9EUKA|nr:hypothetical protein BLNAU_12865 [Blattamonas nauphoetae]
MNDVIPSGFNIRVIDEYYLDKGAKLHLYEIVIKMVMKTFMMLAFLRLFEQTYRNEKLKEKEEKERSPPS